MGDVISATTKFSTRQLKRERFLASARDLLDSARKEMAAGAFDLALEYAYRGALRVAGACIADSVVLARRKRLPSSAWERLALVGEAEKEWAQTFSGFSRLRSRVMSGIEKVPPAGVAEEVVELAAEFLAETEGSAGLGQVA
ncbi:hypothetical protein C3B44_03630 [Corynebacterium yudongzhengii]|uniref:SAV-6107-like HEPN domain-containing protein n=1 Tax=Corynebacterium yudongzhengii TaxID=2080740 RepID=A0A2U1T7J9_9CORY|nr:SAV_6107 family HEPN domain-containing protein [Corynebacterium yudongzhengii]AWB81561.1 hypothetical protein C3B44_03630 [Corynebacterium yudongzhengii]PWC01868.1 hypothetical protein DF222_04615 [Corynebacterium yudongzhengii]